MKHFIQLTLAEEQPILGPISHSNTIDWNALKKNRRQTIEKIIHAWPEYCYYLTYHIRDYQRKKCFYSTIDLAVRAHTVLHQEIAPACVLGHNYEVGQHYSIIVVSKHYVLKSIFSKLECQPQFVERDPIQEAHYNKTVCMLT